MGGEIGYGDRFLDTLHADVTHRQGPGMAQGDVDVVCVEEPIAAADLSEHDPALLSGALARLV